MQNQESAITIGQDSFEDLLAGRTGNPIAENEIPEMLRAAIKTGRLVLVTGPDGKASHKLILSADGKFQCLPIS